ncbi:hypothetical protein [Candidatus Oleimmundimicrobium sp.]|uniref:hypothetical protein n=1 Tax=Candidatus Oleimmundimicrobium sp. TaxID=3060597 RepID=UPI0027291B64|nr:hypothetical protein [Candidatus Oleimmundimicrobium sp.]MDO8885759.1 hypothetical protein [Candidatus Oleimmundimicrobium sp.]
MIANTKQTKSKRKYCIFCGQRLFQPTSVTCGSIECKDGLKLYKALQRSKTMNCEFAKVNKDGRVRCSKGLFHEHQQKKGYPVQAIWRHPVKACVKCSVYANAGEFTKEELERLKKIGGLVKTKIPEHWWEKYETTRKENYKKLMEEI